MVYTQHWYDDADKEYYSVLLDYREGKRLLLMDYCRIQSEEIGVEWVKIIMKQSVVTVMEYLNVAKLDWLHSVRVNRLILSVEGVNYNDYEIIVLLSFDAEN